MKKELMSTFRFYSIETPLTWA